MASDRWKVGDLAAATGLTVRTLHHWDEQGLVRPSARTSSGHRLYDRADVGRVYRVVALRELGLGLQAIAGVLADDGPALGPALQAHADLVRRQVVALQAVERRLGLLVQVVRAAGTPSAEELLQLMHEVTTMSAMFEKYFDEGQRAVLEQRHAQRGDAGTDAVRAEWPTVISGLEQARLAGTDPADPQVQALGRRWRELLAVFDGGDPALRAANDRMRRENPEQARAAGAPSDELIAYVTRVQRAGT